VQQQDPYTQVIDLTSTAQRQKREKNTRSLFPVPEPRLPEAVVCDLPSGVQQAWEATGWSAMMPVQKTTMPYILDGQDLMVQSRTGSGKTGAFLLPLFGLLSDTIAATQALIITPTRELARQIYSEFERMRPPGATLQGAVVYGGVSYRPQIEKLARGTHVVVGTPGRLLDHLQRGTFSLQQLRVLVLDEADEMLSMGFYPAIVEMHDYLPARRQSLLFSATLPPRVRMLARQFLHTPSFLGLSAGQISVETIAHRYYRVDRREKDRCLLRLIERDNPESALIFANTKREVEYLAQVLANYGLRVAELSGDLSQPARERAMARLRRGELRFLVATDVAARGIDITDLSHVFQYDVPTDPEYYIHRTGRTARAGKAGVAITLVAFEEEIRLLRIGQKYSIKLEKCIMPDQQEVVARAAERMVVLLEEKMRDKSNLERERLQRFSALAQELARREPALLAMVLDELYHTTLHGGGSGSRKKARHRRRKRRR